MSITVDLMDEAEAAAAARPGSDEGLGCLRTELGNLPLESVEVRAQLTGLASRTELVQGFRNTHPQPLEATYVFPLPPRAAVTAMRMEADGRVIEGLLKERGEAREDYDQAIAAGQRASIAEEERPGVFTMRVGNILPGERVSVQLTLAGSLSYEDGQATYRLPLVVAPRYIPGAPLEGGQTGDGTARDTDAVPDASRISPPVLLPGFPNPVRLTAEVDIDPAGLPLAGVSSSLHTVVTGEHGDGLRVRLEAGERADRDFLLRLKIGDESALSTSLAVRAEEDGGGTFALTVLPPAGKPAERNRDVVLVLDRSGSMGGWKMVAARRAAARIVDTLGTGDRLAVLAFDNTCESPPGLGEGLVEADDRNRFRAVEFLAGVDARGGTEMYAPLHRAANLLSGRTHREQVLVLVTDGQIGNEDQLLHSLGPQLDGVRVHTVGIDRAVNEAFLQRLSGSTGRCELVESEDRLDEAMHNIHRRIGTPLATGLRVLGDGLAIEPDSLAPEQLPDLYPGVPVVITGRFTGPATGGVAVLGQPELSVQVEATPSANPALAALWARARVRDLEDRYVTGSGGSDLEDRIVATSLRFGVLSRFTAFVAVDQREVAEGGRLHKVTQPVEQPSGWQNAAPMTRGLGRGGASGIGVPLSGNFGGFQGGAPGAAPGFAPGGQQSYSHAPESVSPQQGGYGGGDPYGSASATSSVPAGTSFEQAQPAPVNLAEFVQNELRLLREHRTQPHAALLDHVCRRIRALLAGWWPSTGPETARAELEALADLLSAPGRESAAELDRRWQRAITVLEKLEGAPRRRAFWKR